MILKKFNVINTICWAYVQKYICQSLKVAKDMKCICHHLWLAIMLPHHDYHVQDNDPKDGHLEYVIRNHLVQNVQNFIL